MTYLSLHEAEQVMKNMKDSKDFWIVNSMQSNEEILQESLDLLYDDGGKFYKVRVVNNQSGSRLAIWCDVCSVILSSYDPFVSHNKGKSHKKSVIQQNLGGNDSMKNLLGPITFKSLKEIENNFEPGTLEDRLFSTSHFVLGWQFVYREVSNGRSSYTCQLCSNRFSRRMGEDEMFEHIVSDGHLLQYMNVKFGRKGSYNSLFDYIKSVQEMEGKISHTITTLKSDSEPIKTKYAKVEEVPSTSTTTTHSPVLEPSPSLSTPESVLRKKDASCQVDCSYNSKTQFMVDVTKHYDYIAKKGDHTTEELKDDIEGQDLLIQVIKVLAQKLLLYSLTHDHEIENDSKALLKKTENFKLAIPDS